MSDEATQHPNLFSEDSPEDFVRCGRCGLGYGLYRTLWCPRCHPHKAEHGLASLEAQLLRHETIQDVLVDYIDKKGLRP